MSQRPHRSAIVGVGILLGLVLLVYMVQKVSFVHSGRSKTSTIIHNLRLIDRAKQQWALEHHQTGNVAVRKEDLTPYLKRPPYLDGWVKPVAGEIYTARALPEFPEAELTQELGNWPRGTRLLLNESNFTVVLPDDRAEGTGGRTPPLGNPGGSGGIHR